MRQNIFNTLRVFFIGVLLTALMACSEQKNTNADKPSLDGQPEQKTQSVQEKTSTEIQGYELVKKAQAIPNDGNLLVEEFFLYSCPHCYDLEPALEHWLKHKPKDVTFTRVPAILGKQWGAYAHIYYVMEHNGFIEQSHGPMFEAIHKNGKYMNNLPELTPFLAQYGMSEAQVKQAFEGEQVDPVIRQKVKDALVRISVYGLDSVPSFVVNGKYKVTARTAGGSDKVFDVIDKLLEKERASK